VKHSHSHIIRSRRVARAFTLVETIAAITVLSVIASVTSSILWTSIQGYARGALAADLHTQASIALEQVVRNLRNIPKVSAASAPDIASFSSTSITWNTDYTLSLDGAELVLRSDGGVPRTLITGVTSFSLQAFDQSNVELASSLSGNGCLPIRRFLITMTIQRDGVSETVRTKVFIRSLIAGS